MAKRGVRWQYLATTSPAAYRLIDLPFGRPAEMLSVGQRAFTVTHPESVLPGVEAGR